MDEQNKHLTKARRAIKRLISDPLGLKSAVDPLRDDVTRLTTAIDANAQEYKATIASVLDGLNYQLGELLERANEIDRVLQVIRPQSLRTQTALDIFGGRIERAISARYLSPEDQERFLALLRQFQPRKVIRFAKIRIGRKHDGGYVMIDDFEGVSAAFSCGIGSDVSWDLALAERGIAVHQFDHTVEGEPTKSHLFTFKRTKVSAHDGRNTISLNTILGTPENAVKKILKLDIEGDEWAALAAASPQMLQKCSQIICEFHGFWHIYDKEWLKSAELAVSNLKQFFDVVHVHGNNAASFVNLANVIFPEIIEVTFANRALYEMIDSDECFPTDLDSPNEEGVADLHLGSFKF
jgi:hypothetical protein